jgi:hypothetical protein
MERESGEIPYGLDDSRDARIAKSLTRDEARRIASNIAKLPALLGKGSWMPQPLSKVCPKATAFLSIQPTNQS